MYLLARFAYLAPQSGGLLMDKGKSAAVDMLSSMLAIMDGTEIMIPLKITERRTCQWPRPPVSYYDL